jgi:hypothetical protein
VDCRRPTIAAGHRAGLALRGGHRRDQQAAEAPQPPALLPTSRPAHHGPPLAQGGPPRLQFRPRPWQTPGRDAGEGLADCAAPSSRRSPISGRSWRGGTGTLGQHAGREINADRRSTPTRALAKERTGISQQQISKWRRRLADALSTHDRVLIKVPLLIKPCPILGHCFPARFAPSRPGNMPTLDHRQQPPELPPRKHPSFIDRSNFPQCW